MAVMSFEIGTILVDLYTDCPSKYRGTDKSHIK